MGEEPARKRARVMYTCEPSTSSLRATPPLLAPEINVFSETESVSDVDVHDSGSEIEEQPSAPMTSAMSAPSASSVTIVNNGTLLLWR